MFIHSATENGAVRLKLPMPRFTPSSPVNRRALPFLPGTILFFWLLDACLPAMREAGRGAVVVPTSATALRSSSHPIAGYEMARAAQLQLVRTVAREVAGDGVRVNAVAPNFIENPSYFPPETVSDPAFVEAVRREVPAQRLGSGAEAAATVFWLASPEASYVHGAVLPVDGGWRLG